MALTPAATPAIVSLANKPYNDKHDHINKRKCLCTLCVLDT